MLNLFEESPKNNRSFQEMQAQHKKDGQFSDKVAMLLLFFVIAPFVIWLMIEAMDNATN